MDKVTLKRYIKFIRNFGVEIDGKFIYVHDGHNSLILNPDTPWKEFLGHSVFEVAEAVAKELKLQIKQIE